MEENEHDETMKRHDTNMGDSPPVKQHPRQVPLALRGELSKLVQEILESGVIEEPSSPWSSPCKEEEWISLLLCGLPEIKMR